jgi:hypothetical protein
LLLSRFTSIALNYISANSVVFLAGNYVFANADYSSPGIQANQKLSGIITDSAVGNSAEREA